MARLAGLFLHLALELLTPRMIIMFTFCSLDSKRGILKAIMLSSVKQIKAAAYRLQNINIIPARAKKTPIHLAVEPQA